MPKVGGKRKKTRTHKHYQGDGTDNDDLIVGKTPQAFIFKRGKMNKPVQDLVHDMRDLMYPYSSMSLKESDKTRIREYVKASAMFDVTHMVIFTSTKRNNYVRFIKNPDGPTITFKIVSYCGKKHVINSLSRKKSFSKTFVAPVLVMSGFSKAGGNVAEHQQDNAQGTEVTVNPPKKEHYFVTSQMIQSMFAPINLNKAKLSTVQRVVQFTYDAEQDLIYMRHYKVQLLPTSQNRNMRKLLRARKPPDLSQFNSFSEYISQSKVPGSGNVTDSEAEDIPAARLDLEQTRVYNREEKIKKQMSVRLTEMGPRLKLRLYKIEEGLLKGNVIYNRVVERNSEQIEAQRIKIRDKQLLKEQRRFEQQQRVNEKMKEQKKKDIEKDKKLRDKKQKKQDEEGKIEEEGQEEQEYQDGDDVAEDDYEDEDESIIDEEDANVSDADYEEAIQNQENEIRELIQKKRKLNFMEDKAEDLGDLEEE